MQRYRRGFGAGSWQYSRSTIRVGLQKVLTLWFSSRTGNLQEIDWIKSDLEEISTQGFPSFADMLLTCSWTITLDGTLRYLEEVQRALTGTGRDCALSASCSLQRLWISLSRRTFSLPKSCTRCSEGQESQKLSQLLQNFYMWLVCSIKLSFLL